MGRRLAEARSNAQLTQQQAADHLGVLRTAIAQAEIGARSVTTDELIRLARLYGRSVDFFFLSDEDAQRGEDAVTVLCRMAPELQDDPKTGVAIRRLVEVFQAGAGLKSELGLQSRTFPPTYEVPLPQTPAEAAAQGATIADQERQRLGLGEAPIADIHEVVASQNIWTASDHLPEEISGLFLNHPSIGMAVVVNHSHNRWRQRFTCAPDYAHALIDRDVNITNSSPGNGKSLIETRANAIAGAFLVPRRAVESMLANLEKGGASRQAIATYDVASESAIESERRAPSGSQDIGIKDVGHLAMCFDVSFQVVCYRLRSLGYLNKKSLEHLLAQEAAGNQFVRLASGDEGYGDWKNRNGDSSRHVASQMLPLILEAYHRGVISRGRLLDLCSLLQMAGEQVLQIAQQT